MEHTQSTAREFILESHIPFSVRSSLTSDLFECDDPDTMVRKSFTFAGERQKRPSRWRQTWTDFKDLDAKHKVYDQVYEIVDKLPFKYFYVLATDNRFRVTVITTTDKLHSNETVQFCLVPVGVGHKRQWVVQTE